MLTVGEIVYLVLYSKQSMAALSGFCLTDFFVIRLIYILADYNGMPSCTAYSGSSNGGSPSQTLVSDGYVICWLYLSRIMRKPAFCICENKGAAQLRCCREADQRLCFRHMDDIITLLAKSEISSL